MARSTAVAAADDSPPAPATMVRAVDVPDDRGGVIEISWSLSVDDHAIAQGVGGATVLAAAGPVAIYRGHGLDSYRIYRGLAGVMPHLIAEVPFGATQYLDSTAFNEVIYTYEVRAVDGAHEAVETVAAGSTEDRARSAFAFDNAGQLPGWFDPSDDRIDFNDFFLFADHFGTVDGQASYDPLYDLSPNHVIDFDDFFIFADNFGRLRPPSALPGN